MQPAPARLLIVPGLHDSGPAHWQTWLQAQYGHARRVVQRDFSRPDLARWAERIQRTLESAAPGPWVAVAHSFGVLAVVQHLAEHPESPIREALLVAPAEPDRFGLAETLPRRALPRPLQLVTSSNDPWMSLASANRWAQHWGAAVRHLGAAGHVNSEAGFGPWPLARHWVDEALQRASRPNIAQAA